MGRYLLLFPLKIGRYRADLTFLRPIFVFRPRREQAGVGEPSDHDAAADGAGARTRPLLWPCALV